MKVYIAGPMRGYPEFNFPAFDEARERLRTMADISEVFCPAEHDRSKGFDPVDMHGTDQELEANGFDLAESLTWDLTKVLEADTIAMLPGWSKSSGARHEKATAELVGKRVMYYWPHRLSNLPLLPDPMGNDIPTAPLTDDEVRTVSSTGGEKGMKLARYDLIPAGPLEQLAEHYGRGAQKYADRNWERGYEWSKSFAAMMRHAWAHWSGEDIDPETGSPHLVAVAWHAFAQLEFMVTHPEFDDRPKRGQEDAEAEAKTWVERAPRYIIDTGAYPVAPNATAPRPTTAVTTNAGVFIPSVNGLEHDDTEGRESYWQEAFRSRTGRVPRDPVAQGV